MAEDNIRPFRTRDAQNVPTEEERALHKKIRRHRLGGRAAIVVLLLAAAILIAYFYMDYQRKTYSNYSIIEWNELSGMENSNSVSFGGNILRYNKDGVAYVDYTNAQIWNQPYEMGSPMLDVSDQAAAVADKGGNKIYLFDEKGLTGEIDTVLPIQKIAVSDADTVAVLLKDGSVSRVNYYNKSGEVISEMKIGMDNMGYPMAMDVSPDGKMFMLSFLSVSGGSLDTVISYYNFGNVGQEYKDRLVKSKTYEDERVPGGGISGRQYFRGLRGYHGLYLQRFPDPGGIRHDHVCAGDPERIFGCDASGLYPQQRQRGHPIPGRGVQSEREKDFLGGCVSGLHPGQAGPGEGHSVQ